MSDDLEAVRTDSEIDRAERGRVAGEAQAIAALDDRRAGRVQMQVGADAVVKSQLRR